LILLSVGACTAIIQNNVHSPEEQGLVALPNQQLTVSSGSLIQMFETDQLQGVEFGIFLAIFVVFKIVGLIIATKKRDYLISSVIGNLFAVLVLALGNLLEVWWQVVLGLVGAGIVGFIIYGLEDLNHDSTDSRAQAHAEKDPEKDPATTNQTTLPLANPPADKTSATQTKYMVLRGIGAYLWCGIFSYSALWLWNHLWIDTDPDVPGSMDDGIGNFIYWILIVVSFIFGELGSTVPFWE
jgi:hypothetical protein